MQKQIFTTIFALLIILVVLLAQSKIQHLFGLAAYKPANIIIDTRNQLGPMKNNWSSFAQGGEEAVPMLKSVIPKLKLISPLYIRIDHIYDSYSVVEKEGESYKYNFSRLDEVVDDILNTGALPFFCLSYMPPVFNKDNSLIDPPDNWNDWQELIKATVEHFSGKNNRNLANVYYEVWNEPELPQFGGWKLTEDKDYRLLYFFAEKGAKEAQNTNQFFIGGPAIGSYYPEWINKFFSYASQNDLRLDFFSWHRYTKKPEEFISDVKNTRNGLSAFPKYKNTQLIISEWGIESTNDPINNSYLAAAFVSSAIVKFYPIIDHAFHFEIKDGPPPNGGKWGLFYHDKDDKNPLTPKPKYQVFSAYNKIKGNILSLTGEGTFINGFSTQSSSNINVIITNYDINEKNIENVPITFTGLTPSAYKLKYEYLFSDVSGSFELVTTDGTLNKSFILNPNQILLLELTPLAPIANFIQGVKNQDNNDKSLILSNSANSPLVFLAPEFRLLPKGSIGFDLKSLWDMGKMKSFTIFEAPYSTASGITNKLYLLKDNHNNLVFGIGGSLPEIKISTPINWQKDTWHNIEVFWDTTGISLLIDNQLIDKVNTPLGIRNGKSLTFFPIEAAIDNLKINIAGQQTIIKDFND